MATEAASLFVKVTGDISDASKKLGHIGDTAQKTGGVMKGALSTALGFGAASIGLNLVGDAMGTLQQGAIGMNAELETSTMQFETLMGSSDKAKKHVEELFDFAAKTPFESGPIIQASRTMRTFGGDALDTKKNLTLFGNAAAATSQPIDEVAFWMSRAYAAIKGGQPFGEARMRLMEMGIITPQVAQEMENLQKKGAKTSEVWGAMTGELGKFGGAMEKQAGTFEGLASTFQDNLNMALAKGAKPLFDGLKGVLGGVNELMASPAFQGALEAASRGMAKAFQFLGDTIGAVWSVVSPILGAIGSAVSAISGGADGLNSSFGNLGGQIAQFATQALSAIGAMIEEMVPKFAEMAGKAADWIIAALPGFLDNLASYIMSMGNYLIAHLPDIVAKLAEWGAAFVGWIIPRIPQILAALGQFLVKIGGWLIGTAAPKLLGMAAQVGMALVKGFLQFVIGPPGLLERIVTFWNSTLIPGILKFGPIALKAAGDIARSFVNGFIKFMGSLPGKVANVIRDAFGKLHIDIGPFHISAKGVDIDLPNISLPGFATGSWNVPFTGPALIHKGEMVIPADLAARLRHGQGIGASGGSLPYAGGGGGVTVVVNVGSYYGTEDHLRRLSQGIGEQVRLATPRRTAIQNGVN